MKQDGPITEWLTNQPKHVRTRVQNAFKNGYLIGYHPDRRQTQVVEWSDVANLSDCQLLRYPNFSRVSLWAAQDELTARGYRQQERAPLAEAGERCGRSDEAWVDAWAASCA